MDPQKLVRRNAAAKLFEDSSSSSSSGSSSSSSSGSSSSFLYTRAMEFYDRTSFPIEGVEGEFDRICHGLGLTGPEASTIPAEAIKVRSSFDISPRPKEKEEIGVAEAETSGCGTGGGAIRGFRPPMLTPPPGMKTCSTGDSLSASDDDDDREEEDKEENAAMIEEIVGGFSGFTTSNEDDSSSTTTDPRSSNTSPNGRIKLVITAGNWEKGELLGRGSHGSVYEGISDDGFFFAVKEVSLLDHGSQGRQSVYQLEQEIGLLSQLEHENIVQYFGTEMDQSNLYIFLELVTKGSLRNLYQRYNLRDSQVSAYTRQILHGLKYLHDQNIVHRDIKCANILVDANGSVKLADFGLAKAIKLNDVKSCKGTAFWMAPEVVNGENSGYGLPVDIWSLGCTVLEMLTSEIPYSPLECVRALFKIGSGEPPPVPDSLSRDARDFILQCLNVNPDERPSAAQLLNHTFVQRPLSHSPGSASPYIRGPGSISKSRCCPESG